MPQFDENIFWNLLPSKWKYFDDIDLENHVEVPVDYTIPAGTKENQGQLHRMLRLAGIEAEKLYDKIDLLKNYSTFDNLTDETLIDRWLIALNWKSYGLTLTLDQKKFILKHIGELNQRRGRYDILKFVIYFLLEWIYELRKNYERVFRFNDEDVLFFDSDDTLKNGTIGTASDEYHYFIKEDVYDAGLIKFIIFGEETSDLSEWDTVFKSVTAFGDIIQATPGLNESLAKINFQILAIDVGVDYYVDKTIIITEDEVIYDLYINLSDTIFGNGTERVITFLDLSGTKFYELYLKYTTADGYQIKLKVYDDASSTTDGNYIDVSSIEDIWIRIYHKRADTVSSADGIYKVYVNEILQDTISSIDNFDNHILIDKIQLGIENVPADIEGNFYADEILIKENDTTVFNAKNEVKETKLEILKLIVQDWLPFGMKFVYIFFQDLFLFEESFNNLNNWRVHSGVWGAVSNELQIDSIE